MAVCRHSEKGLDDADIDAVFEQVRCERVAQRVHADALGDVRRQRRLDDDTVQLPRAERDPRIHAREKPAIDMHHAQLAAGTPPSPQEDEQAFRKHGVAVTPTFSPLDPEQHPFAVDVADLERRDRPTRANQLHRLPTEPPDA